MCLTIEYNQQTRNAIYKHEILKGGNNLLDRALLLPTVWRRSGYEAYSCDVIFFSLAPTERGVTKRTTIFSTNSWGFG